MSEAMTTICGNCGKGLKIRAELAGKRIKCPACGVGFMPGETRALSGGPVASGGVKPPPVPGGSFPGSSFANRHVPESSGGGFTMSGGMIAGIIMILLGAGLTGGTYAIASASPGGGRYYVFYGLMIAGAFRCLRSLGGDDE